MTTKEKIKRLSIDPIFGIYTRPALEIFIEEMYEDNNSEFTAIFIDIKDLHMMNRDIGYEKTNKKISESFYLIKNYILGIDIIARWFSGDEIVLIFNNKVSNKTIINKNIIKIIEFFESFEIYIRYDIFYNVKSVKDLSSKIKHLRD